MSSQSLDIYSRQSAVFLILNYNEDCCAGLGSKSSRKQTSILREMGIGQEGFN